MKNVLLGIWKSLPVQLIFLHFRKYQLLLLFWFLLGSAISGGFMNHFGSDSLFLAPEYLGKVSFISALVHGYRLRMFYHELEHHHIYSVQWLLPFSGYFFKTVFEILPQQLGIPLLFSLIISFNPIRFDKFKELMNTGEILLIAAGFICGLVLFYSVFYFLFLRKWTCHFTNTAASIETIRNSSLKIQNLSQ